LVLALKVDWLVPKYHLCTDIFQSIFFR
jgi:hypothetical protein